MIPKVSIVVPIYNVEKFLPRCMESLLRQTLHEIEIILVDDESPDNCSAMCDEYQKQDRRIKVVHKKNGGLGYARNSGIEVAEGEYIAFVDSDDYVELDMYEKMYHVAETQNVDLVWAEKYNEKSNGDITNSSYSSPTRKGKYNREELLAGLLYPQFGMLPNEGGDKYVSCSSCTNIYRRNIITQFNLRFDSERNFISEDLLFNLKFMMVAESAYVMREQFYHYIVNEQSLTHVYRPDRFDRELVFYHECIKRLEELEIYEECKVRLYRHLLIRARKCVKRELVGNLDKKNAKNNVKKILSCNELQYIFSVYDSSKLPLKYKVVYHLMQYQMVNVLMLISRKI